MHVYMLLTKKQASALMSKNHSEAVKESKLCVGS